MSQRAITYRQIRRLRALIDESARQKRNSGREWVATKDLNKSYEQRGTRSMAVLVFRGFAESVRVFGGQRQWRPTSAGRQALRDFDVFCG